MSAARWLAAGGLALWVVSLSLPAIDGPGFPALSGMDVLRQGAGAWRDGVVAWYANPLLGIALVLVVLGRFRLALACSFAAAALALSSFTAGPAAESAGRSVPAFNFAVGFHVWLAAFGLLIAAAVTGLYKVWQSGKTA